jgi:type III secretory pathway component EscV
MDEDRKPSLARRAIAAVVLVVAAILVIRIVVGFLSAIFWIVALAVLVVAVIWALTTLRSGSGSGSSKGEKRVKPSQAEPLPMTHDDRVAAEMAKIQRELRDRDKL